MIFYIATDENNRRHLVGTQADARAINKDFEQVDIPTSKEELRQFVQDLFDRADRIQAHAPTERDEIPVFDAPEPIVERVVQEVPADLAGAVLDLDQKALIPVLSNAICRLGELAGYTGWQAFARQGAGGKSVEQGLGMLMQASLRHD